MSAIFPKKTPQVGGAHAFYTGDEQAEQAGSTGLSVSHSRL